MESLDPQTVKTIQLASWVCTQTICMTIVAMYVLYRLDRWLSHKIADWQWRRNHYKRVAAREDRKRLNALGQQRRWNDRDRLNASV